MADLTSNKQYDLIFVHGTWAREGDFGTKETILVRTIMEFCGPESQHYRFTWSGRNAVGARERASSEFKDFSSSLSPKTADRKRLIICHSHGGSVVLSALMDGAISAKFDGIISIGTPFLHVYRLDEVEPSIIPLLSIKSAVLAWVFPLFLAWLIFGDLYLFSALLSGFDWANTHPISTLAITVIGVIIGYGLMLLSIFFSLFWAIMRPGFNPWDLDAAHADEVESLTTPPDDAVWRIKERCRLPHVAPLPTLLLRVPGDETYGALIASRAISFVIVRIYGFIILPITIAKTRWKFMPYIGSAISSLFGCIQFLTKCALSLPVIFISGICLFLFGYEFIAIGGRILISVESTPPGTWQLTVLPPLDRTEYRQEKMAEYWKTNWVHGVHDLEERLKQDWQAATQGALHSRGYNDPRAIALIINWIKGLSDGG